MIGVILGSATRCPVDDFATFLTFQKHFILGFFIIRHQFPLMIAYFG